MKPTYEELERQLEESQREFRAADATIHNLELKITDLAVQLANAESKCRELAAENAKLADCANFYRLGFKPVKVAFGIEWKPTEQLLNDCGNTAVEATKTPATDAFLAEVRVSAIRDALNESSDYLDTDCVMDRLDISYEDAELRTSGAIELHDALVAVANQLRKGE